ncbi:hypothetical protein IQ273_03240 [Nodosilinea sp. LEGE 07298]|uniref:hypothetical protein n=1 Tax=Nodosilinea sp. LEGE 07298 TaxID=2777970 RepID=UPI0018826F80|nr:hypothetical protein [Nodosilinea sp. LEGE 07298]MBE9108433.1 hypothetical protein [Nodosilinea sp. LEGE 07298]
MDSKDWAGYIEATDGLSKPWLLLQWRLQLLQEQRPQLDPETYATELAALHQALMNLGEWWQGQEEAVFGAEESFSGES